MMGRRRRCNSVESDTACAERAKLCALVPLFAGWQHHCLTSTEPVSTAVHCAVRTLRRRLHCAFPLSSPVASSNESSFEKKNPPPKKKMLDTGCCSGPRYCLCGLHVFWGHSTSSRPRVWCYPMFRNRTCNTMRGYLALSNHHLD
jgi:hypothetical protein